MNIKILRKYFNNIVLFFISTNIMIMLSFGIILNDFSTHIEAQMNYNISEYNEIDREQLCRISSCMEVNSIVLHKHWKMTDGKILQLTEYNKPEYIKMYNNIVFDTTNNKLALYNFISDSYYVVDTKNILDDYILILKVFLPLGLLIFILPMYFGIKQEQEESLLLMAGNEALLNNRSMINITENIHHELNTPLEVIDNKVEKIHRKIQKYLAQEYEYYLEYADEKDNEKMSRYEWNKNENRSINKQLIELTDDFEFIKMASEQIYGVLEKMKGFKQLRYSNGNKTVKNIIDGAFKIINISNSNFKYKVDKQLGNYKLDNLKNVDLLNIILNHIKNSLEANSTHIVILFNEYSGGVLKFRIIDNGNGIPKEVQPNIFIPNFSTKSIENGIRGNGMYLNKHILKSNGGDVELISTSERGTTIEITIKVKQRNN